MYEQMATLPVDLVETFNEINVNSFGRAMAYLTRVYLKNIPENEIRETVRLVAETPQELRRRVLYEECFLGLDACLHYKLRELKLTCQSVHVLSLFFRHHQTILPVDFATAANLVT